jgi:non-specific serine/threonine protein kinase/serine/threonine-protein kinase
MTHRSGAARLTPTDFFQIETIFDEVVDLDPSARHAVLDARLIARPDLRAQIDALLDSHARLAGFLHTVGRPDDDRSEDAEPFTDDPRAARLRSGSRAGPYQLLEKIGEGGMGDVYLADRVEGEFAQRVAVKVTRASLRDTESARRFRAERQILASLQHPNIVTLLDGGTTESGEAYLVMEYVDGVPLTKYCAAQALSLETRLQLLRQVCTAVQYAHQRGIVHRDLKPANILVSADGVPKVVDFGVAKLLESSALASVTITSFFPGPLTPNYASPEQLRGLAVTTASDVYALGVLAYEVIAGVRPYDTSGKTLDQVLDIVLETEPVRPSSATTIPGHAGPLPDYPRTRLKGDLDAIVMRAMRKAPEARYGSAGELADDLDRYAQGQPVVAREPSLGYILRRLAARHRAAVLMAAASLVAILGALGVAVWQRQVALRQEARAEQRFRDVRQLANALIFKIHNAVSALPGSTAVRQTIVTEALAYLERLEAESQGDETLRLELGAAYLQIGAILGDPGNANLGDRGGALHQYERARALVQPLATRNDPDPMAVVGLININRYTAHLQANQGQGHQAIELAQQALDAAERLYAQPQRHRLAGETRARAAFTRASVVENAEESIAHWQRARQLSDAELAEKPDDTDRMRTVALVEKYLGGRFDGLGRDGEAEVHYRRALELDDRRYTRDPGNRIAQFDLAIDLANVASVLEEQKRIEEAYPMFLRSLELRRQLVSADPKDELARGRLAYIRMRMAKIELRRGRTAEALTHVREGIAHHETVVARTNAVANRRELASALVTLADILSDKPAESCAAFRRAHQMFEAASPTNYEFYANRAKAGVAACDTREKMGR